jgi:hypothetical protein
MPCQSSTLPAPTSVSPSVLTAALAMGAESISLSRKAAGIPLRKALALGEIGPVVGAAAPVRAVIPPARSNATARQKAASPPFPRKRAKCDPSVMQML